MKPLLLVLSLLHGILVAQEGSQRVVWSDEALRGHDGEPLPFVVTRMAEDWQFRNPVELVADPRSDTGLFVVEVNGPIYWCENDQRHLVADLRTFVPRLSQVYGWAFHPNYQSNQLVYLCYVLEGQDPQGSIVSEFRVHRDDLGRPQLDVASERMVITWVAGGHNGGSLQFGNDGYLYISTGDGSGPNPPDILHTGQDCSDLLSSILRIDVDRRDAGLAYRIPPDNPFSDTALARPEIWAFGFRNPWRMSFDVLSGDLWVGDVGWDTWEYIFRVERGGNYGWSVMEGRQPINVTWPRGPSPVVPPTVEHSHLEARSITGGYVYWGQRFPQLRGHYIYGDYETGKIWASQRQGERWLSREIADTDLHISCFGVDQQGELLVVDYGGGLYRLSLQVAPQSIQGLPQRLSETGLFQSLNPIQPALGVQAYQIRNQRWADGLTAQHWLALATEDTVRLGGRGNFPDRMVLVKTLSLPNNGRPIETQVLQHREGSWRTFSYAWNEDQTDAALVPKQGLNRPIPAGDHVRGEVQRWSHLARTECAVCHQAQVGYVLGFNEDQLGGDQVEALTAQGFIAAARGRRRWRRDEPQRERRSEPREVQAAVTVESQARDYLHVNCAPCHQDNGGGLVPMDLRRGSSNDRLKAIGVPPQRGDFEIPNARVIAPGLPANSTLYYRMAKAGSGHMPHLGSNTVDPQGLALVRAWIEAMPRDDAAEQGSVSPVSEALARIHEVEEDEITVGLASEHPFVRDLFQRFVVDPIQEVSGTPSAPLELDHVTGDADRGRALLQGARGALCLSCHQLGGGGQSLGPPLNGVGSRLTRMEILESLVEPSKVIAEGYRSYRIGTKSGDVLDGFLVHHDRHGVVLRQAASTERTIAIEDLATMTVSDQSMMPAGLLQAFSAQESADLLAFLSHLK